MATEQKGSAAAMFKRLPSAQLKKIRELADAELNKRSPKDLGGMSDSEFRKYVDEQFSKADQAAREADLRKELGGKSAKPKNDDSTKAEKVNDNGRTR